MATLIVLEGEAGIQFVLMGDSEQVLLRSHYYTALKNCKRGMRCLSRIAHGANLEQLNQANAGASMACPKFQVFPNSSGKGYVFHLKARNGDILMTSDPQPSAQACLNMIVLVRSLAATAQWIFA